VPSRPGLLSASFASRTLVAPRLAAALGLAAVCLAASCSALVPKGAALENCLHICAGNRACEWECREQAGEEDDAPAAKAAGGGAVRPADDDGEDGEPIAPPPAR
jgi:hypothetical protein